MKSNVQAYDDLAMNRVDNFFSFSDQQRLMRCIVTIESVDISDEDDGIFILKINATELGHSDPMPIKFRTLVGDNIDEYKVGTVWKIIGGYTLDWDNREIQLFPITQELLAEHTWVSNYVMNNRETVKKHFLKDTDIVWFDEG